MYRRKVKGRVLGQSKTGSIVYVQPESTEQHTRNLLNALVDEEKELSPLEEWWEGLTVEVKALVFEKVPGVVVAFDRGDLEEMVAMMNNNSDPELSGLKSQVLNLINQ